MSQRLGYARVSTKDQDPTLQHDALNKAGCERIYTDHASGKLAKRPELEKLLGYIRAGDTLVVWKLDRLGRTTKDLILMMEELEKRGVNFKSITQDIDTSTAMGRMFYHLLAAFGEMEHALILERVHAGLQSARARGRVGGRKKALSPLQKEAVAVAWDTKEFTLAQLAEAYRVSVSTIRRCIAESNITEPEPV